MNDNEEDAACYDNDAAYYSSRAEQEEDAARKAVNTLAAKIHRTLASCYRARAVEIGDRQKPEYRQLSAVRD